MKRFAIISLFSMFCFVVFAQNSYNLKFDKNDFKIEKRDSVIFINSLKLGACYTEDINAPAFPYFIFNVLLPMGTTNCKPIIEYDEEVLFENVSIEAPPLSYSTAKIVGPDTLRIASSSVKTPLVYSGVHSRYGYAYSLLKISPFIYDAVEKKLSFISNIKVSYDNYVKNSTNANYDRKKMDMVRNFIINPEALEIFYNTEDYTQKTPDDNLRSGYHGINNGVVDYAIITSETLKPAFQELLEWKIRKGLRAKIYTIGEIDSSSYVTGQPTIQAKIRKWIGVMSDYFGLKYVLLGGDATIIPVQYCQGKYTEGGEVFSHDVPADLYYATYSYTSPLWDNNGNGIIGEYYDLINMNPNVYLTRAPVRNSEDVQYFIQKVLRYEKGNGVFDPSYVNKMLFAGTTLDSYITNYNSAHYLDEIAYNIFIGPYWNGGRHYLYKTDDGTYTNLTSNNTLTVSNLTQLINTSYHFLHMDCHGESDSWNLLTGYYTDEAAADCTNPNRTLIITTACNTNAFDYNSSLSKAFMNNHHGGVAYYGCSRLGFHYSTSTSFFPPNIGQSLLYDSFFFKYLLMGYPTDAPYRYGAAAAYSKMMLIDNANISETDNYRYLQFGINPLGDPEMPIYTSIPSSFTSVQISVNGNGDVTVSTGGIDSCTIALTSIDNGESYFDVVENVSSYTFSEVYSRFYVTITKHNKIPFKSDIVFPGIKGDCQFYGSCVYSMDLPEGYTVDWSITNSSFVNNVSLYQNNPSANKCLISNPNYNYFRGTLVATIKHNNVVVGTRSKIISTGGDFSATIYQQGQTINGITYPTLNNSVVDGGHTGVFELCTITLTSSDLADAVFSFSGYLPKNWIKNPDGTITAAFFKIIGNSQQTCTVTGRNSVTQKIFQFTLHVLPASTLNQLLDITSSEGEYCIVLTHGDNHELTDNWRLTIYDAQTGNVMYRKEVTEGSTFVNTSGWRPGVYIVQGEASGEIVKEKIIVK